MCGIAGVLSLDGAPIEEPLLRRMARRMRHRGPDDEGVLVDDRIGLAAQRLAIIDPSPGGHQPQRTADGGLALVYNGECYNFRELRAALSARGTRFSSDSDTEVVLEGFAAEGPGFLARMVGIFAFAAWDARRRELHLVRDRLGVKPLYWATHGGRLLFASEIRPILEAGHPAALDAGALSHFLALRYVPGARTLFAGIRKVLPGHRLVVRADGRVDETCWWSPRAAPEAPADGAARFLGLLGDAVRGELVADVPVGAFLSGGIDSSVLAALMAGGRPGVETFTFAMRGADDESAAAARLARELGLAHHVVEATPGDYRQLEAAVLALEEPLADAIIVPTYRLAAAAARRVRVVQVGEGADEILGGYVHHLVLARLRAAGGAVGPGVARRLAPLVEAVPRALWNRVFPYPDAPGASGVRRLARALALSDRPMEAYCALGALFDAADQERLLRPEVARAGSGVPSAAEFLSQRWSAIASGDFVNDLIKLDLESWCANYTLPRLDKLTMAHSLEGRVPYLDHRLVELVLSLPGHRKVGWRGRKLLLRDALRGSGLVPEAVRRAPKRPFYLATQRQFDAGYRDYAREVLSDAALRRRGLFQAEAVAALRDAPTLDLLAGKQLAALVILELWARLYLDGRWRDVEPRAAADGPPSGAAADRAAAPAALGRTAS